MRMIRVSVKNPIDWLSADQNGPKAPSVPASGSAAPANGRSQRIAWPSGPGAV